MSRKNIYPAGNESYRYDVVEAAGRSGGDNSIADFIPLPAVRIAWLIVDLLRAELKKVDITVRFNKN